MSNFSVKDAISKLVAGEGDLSESEAGSTMDEIMRGDATPSQIAAFLTAIRMKGAGVGELTAFAMEMKRHSLKIHPKVGSRLVDTCGTGGDKVKTFNISTIAGLVIAGAGVPVAKHGNRSFTSKCGSADLLERLGVNINADPATVENSIEQVGIGFMFAPVFHPAMKHVAASRKEIGIRTVFNILGPMINPAGAKTQVVGVYDEGLVMSLAHVLKKLGTENAMVVHGLDGIDEISLIGKTRVARVISGKNELREEILEPEVFGLKSRTYQEISAEGVDLEAYASVALDVLSLNDPDLTRKELATKEMILMNSSAALVTTKAADNYREGVELAKTSIDSGKALEKLLSLVKHTKGDPDRIGSLQKSSHKNLG